MPTGITTLDLAIIAVYMTAMMSIGVYYSLRTTGSEDYLLGGRQMSSWSIGLSLFATILSTISFLAWPGEIVRHGPVILCQLIAYPIAFGIVGWFLIPHIMQYPVTSAYELLEFRLGASVRYLASGIFLVLRLAWMSVVIYATVQKVLIPVLHLPQEWAPWLCLVVGAVTVIYSTLGGLRAVVVTDVIQAGVLLSAAVASLALITYWLGGVDGWWPTSWPEHWSEPRISFHANERSAMGFLLSMITWYVAMAGSDQMAIQRYLATRDIRSARKALAYAWGVEAFAFALMAMIGLALLAWFTVHPEWLPAGTSIKETPDQLFPLFITYGLPPGISGLVVAGLLAAAMSSLSSGVNSTAAVVTSDFVEGACGFKLSDNGRLGVARWASAVVGGVVVVLSAVVGLLDLNLYELTVRVANLMTGPLFVVFCVAFFMPRATAAAAWAGAISAAAIAITVSFFEHVHGLGFLWITPLSLAGGVLLALITLQIRPAPIANLGLNDPRLRTSEE